MLLGYKSGISIGPLPYSARLEYIESTGTQWIDTGLFADNDYTVKFKIKLSANSSSTSYGVFGTYTGTGGTLCYVSFPNFANSRFNGGWDGYTFGNFALDDSRYDSTFDFVLSNNRATVNDTVWYEYIANVINPNNMTMLLFKTNGSTNNKMLGAFYYFSIEKEGEKILSLIPVLDKAGVACMYDEVSGEFFYNQGTGEFVAGPEIIEYTAKDYIQDGLIAMWDGIENAGWGVHDPNATVWKDLIGERDLYLTSLGLFEDNCLLNNSGGVGASRSEDELTDDGTLDIVFSASGHGKYDTTYHCFLGNKFYFGQRNGVVNGNNRNNTGLYGIIDINIGTTKRSSWTLIRTTENYEGEIWMNGAQQNVSLVSVQGAEAYPISLNASKYNNRFYCVRAYNRALTVEEIAHNYAVDRQRFGL